MATELFNECVSSLSLEAEIATAEQHRNIFKTFTTTSP